MALEDSIEELVALASIHVDGYKRTVGGKTVMVSAYVRSLRSEASDLLRYHVDPGLAEQGDLLRNFGRRSVPDIAYPPGHSRALERGLRGLGNRGRGNGSGTADDPINVKGDVVLAARLLGEGKHVRLNKIHEVGTLLDRLHQIAEESRARGEDAPVFDLCKVSVPKTNLFCAESKGVPRIKMPQLRGVPDEGSLAASLPRTSGGRVDLSDLFRDALRDRGVGIEAKDVPAHSLKASQAELDGPIVAGMMRKMERGDYTEAPLFVTRDGYVIDGHHRWAAKVGVDARDGALGDISMPVEMVDMEIGEALDFARAFASAWGVSSKEIGKAVQRLLDARA